MGTIVSVRKRPNDTDDKCVVCLDQHIQTVLSPCKHRKLCWRCTELLVNQHGADLKCPICRTPVEMVHVFAPVLAYDLRV